MKTHLDDQFKMNSWGSGKKAFDENIWNSQRGRIGAVATIAILLFPPQKSRLLGRVAGSISMKCGLSRKMRLGVV
jgi:hypothetical protein